MLLNRAINPGTLRNQSTMDLELEGKVVMVAAASQGIGRATALAFAREGARLSICARRGDELRAAAEEIVARTGAQVLAVPADLTRPEDVEAWSARTVERFGGIDVLVTNAGGPPAGGWKDFPGDGPWRRAFELNLLSTIRMIRAVVPSMRQRGGGRIVNIQSTSVKAPIPGLILSNAVRPGVVGLAKTLAGELAADNILVNTVAPGRIATARLQSSIAEQVRQRGRLAALVLGVPRVGPRLMARLAVRDIPLRRFGTPEELADVIVFLASARAGYVTGSTIAVDGGLTPSLW
jgi:3-oxoacyl-[acyl-carrier protein] reductase